MANAFQIAHNALLAQLAKAKAPNISNSPTADEILDVREHIEIVAAAVDAYIAELFEESRYMGNVSLPRESEVTPLADFLNDQSITAAFNRAALDYPRQKRA